MALTVENLATPDQDSRILHATSKGMKMAIGDLNGIATDGDGLFTLAASKLKMRKIKSLQGWGNAGGLIGIVFVEVDDLATDSFLVLQQDGTPLASTTLTGKMVHFIALGQ